MDNIFIIHREANGVCLFPVDLKQIWSFIHVQWATVDALMRVASVILHASIHTHTVIQTCSVYVIEKVRNLAIHS